MNNSVLTKNQTKSFGPKFFTEDERRYSITAKIRYDDSCGNGHNSFSVTGSIDKVGRMNSGSCGCIHKEIAEHFPELQKYIKWHLCGSDGPMHYLANTVFLAGDRDCYGYRKDEQRKNKAGVPIWHKVKDAIPYYVDSNEKPSFVVEYEPWLGEGKERELNSARNAAIWPEATDEQLCLPPEELKVLLLTRLPGLIEEFKKDVEELGFVF